MVDKNLSDGHEYEITAFVPRRVNMYIHAVPFTWNAGGLRGSKQMGQSRVSSPMLTLSLLAPLSPSSGASTGLLLELPPSIANKIHTLACPVHRYAAKIQCYWLTQYDCSVLLFHKSDTGIVGQLIG